MSTPPTSAGGSVWERVHPDRPPGRARAPLSVEAIITAAVAIADAEGLDAVSMRRVATELNARTMSLYTHVGSKEDILDLMADRTAGEVLVPEPLPSGWREAITLVVEREREVMSRHPWMVALQSRGPAVGPNGLRHVEQSLRAIAGLGLDGQRAAEVVLAIDHYTLGHAIRESWDAARPPDETGLSVEERAAVRATFYADMVRRGELPLLAPLIAEGLRVRDDSFRRGLTWLLDGIERDLRREG
jgi:AcrR family transcriptional regulator